MSDTQFCKEFCKTYDVAADIKLLMFKESSCPSPCLLPYVDSCRYTSTTLKLTFSSLQCVPFLVTAIWLGELSGLTAALSPSYSGNYED